MLDWAAFLRDVLLVLAPLAGVGISHWFEARRVLGAEQHRLHDEKARRLRAAYEPVLLLARTWNAWAAGVVEEIKASGKPKSKQPLAERMAPMVEEGARALAVIALEDGAEKVLGLATKLFNEAQDFGRLAGGVQKGESIDMETLEEKRRGVRKLQDEMNDAMRAHLAVFDKASRSGT